MKERKPCARSRFCRRSCPLGKTTPDPTYRTSTTLPHKPTLRSESPQPSPKRRRCSHYLMKPFALLSPTRHTLPARANPPAQSHALNQPMKVIGRHQGDAEIRSSELLTILLFLATRRCHLTAHVPTVRVLRLLLSGFQDLWETINTRW